MKRRVERLHRNFVRATGILATTLMFGHPLGAQSPVPIVGTLIDSTNTTIAHAVVTVQATSKDATPLVRTLSGANGRVSGFSLVPGSYALVVRRIGFKPDTQSLKVSASNPAPPFTMVIAAIPISLPPILVEATQCTEFGALATDSVLSRAWDLLETTVVARATLYRDYSYDVVSTDSNYAPERTQQWKVRSESSHRTPSSSANILSFNEPLYRVTFRFNKPSLHAGTEFGLLSPAFKANHCITLAPDESNPGVNVVRFQSLPSASKDFRVDGRIFIDRATSRMSHFSYSIFRKDAYVAHAYTSYGTADVMGTQFPVLSKIGMIIIDPKSGQTLSQGSSSPTYRNFKRVSNRN